MEHDRCVGGNSKIDQFNIFRHGDCHDVFIKCLERHLKRNRKGFTKNKSCSPQVVRF